MSTAYYISKEQRQSKEIINSLRLLLGQLETYHDQHLFDLTQARQEIHTLKRDLFKCTSGTAQENELKATLKQHQTRTENLNKAAKEIEQEYTKLSDQHEQEQQRLDDLTQMLEDLAREEILEEEEY